MNGSPKAFSYHLWPCAIPFTRYPIIFALKLAPSPLRPIASAEQSRSTPSHKKSLDPLVEKVEALLQAVNKICLAKAAIGYFL